MIEALIACSQILIVLCVYLLFINKKLVKQNHINELAGKKLLWLLQNSIRENKNLKAQIEKYKILDETQTNEFAQD